MLMSFSLTVSANEKETTESFKPINEYEKDVTGDGNRENILLLGELFSNSSPYYRALQAEIRVDGDTKWTIPYNGGYDPNLEFIDLNHDGIQDILFQSPTGGSGGLYQYHLHTIQHNKLVEIPLPTQPVIGNFKGHFTAEIKLLPHYKPIEVDVSGRADDYIRLGIYNEDGKLLKNTPLFIDPIAYFEPVLISKSKGYGLKSYQNISGAYHADQLGTVETLWYFENKRWTILQTAFKPTPQ
ncbi:hypothetical protein DX933_07230 [Ornithinibacillus gellani]|nr:hypothetical protein DX933_07230 [Ornithinibacillus gellani]